MGVAGVTDLRGYTAGGTAPTEREVDEGSTVLAQYQYDGLGRKIVELTDFSEARQRA